MEPSEYDNIARMQDKHWWYRGMAAISMRFLNRALGQKPPALRVLDAGCGTGGMLARLSTFGRAFGVDIHPLALAHAQGFSIAPLALASIEHLPFASSSFDAVASFDVLYHLAVGDDSAALREFARVLKPRGVALVRVPALEILRGAHDRIVHTRHRYTAVELRAKLRAAGLCPDRVTYANSLLFLPVLLRRVLQSFFGRKENSDVELPLPFTNGILELILKIEALWLAYFDLPFGVSVFALAHIETFPAGDDGGD